jgi:hypothetical protein
MKIKRKGASLSTKNQGVINVEDDRRRKGWRQFRLQIAAVFLIIVFLASECATILPVE